MKGVAGGYGMFTLGSAWITFSLIYTRISAMMNGSYNRITPMDMIKLENDLYEIIFILSDYLTTESQSYIKSEIIRAPLQTANDILFKFVEKLDLIIEQNDARRNTG